MNRNGKAVLAEVLTEPIGRAVIGTTVISGAAVSDAVETVALSVDTTRDTVVASTDCDALVLLDAAVVVSLSDEMAVVEGAEYASVRFVTAANVV